MWAAPPPTLIIFLINFKWNIKTQKLTKIFDWQECLRCRLCQVLYCAEEAFLSLSAWKHIEFTEFCPTAKNKKSLNPLVKVLGIIYAELTIDRAVDIKPHTHTHTSLKEQWSGGVYVYVSLCACMHNTAHLRETISNVTAWMWDMNISSSMNLAGTKIYEKHRHKTAQTYKSLSSTDPAVIRIMPQPRLTLDLQTE